MINIITYKKKLRFKFKGKRWEDLIKILGYDFKRKRFKYYALKSKIFFKDIRRKKRWKNERIGYLYSIVLNKIKKKSLKLLVKRIFFRKVKKLNKFEKMQIFEFLNTIYSFIEKVNLMTKQEMRIYIKKRNRLINKKLEKKERIFRYKKYYFDNRQQYITWRVKNFAYRARRRERIERVYFKDQIYNLILKQSNNNFFITINDNNNNTLWHRSAGQIFQSEKHNIKLKRSHLLVNEMMPFLKSKLREFKIKYLRIYLKSNVTRHIYKVIDYLIKQGIEFYYIKFIKPMPHHKGDRKKKLKRR